MPGPESVRAPLPAPQPGDPLRATWGEEVSERITELERQSIAAPLPLDATVLVAKITAAGAVSGYYEASTVYWNGSGWTANAAGPVFNAAGYGELYELTGNDGVSIDDIVMVFPVISGTDGVMQWMFNYNKPPTPFFGKIKPGSPTVIIVGAQRAAGTYQWLDTITVEGTALTLNKAAAEQVAISENSVVYYAINVSAAPITATLAVAATKPDDTDTLRHVIIGVAYWDGSKISRWGQQQLGNIIVNPEYKECPCVESLGDLSDVNVS